MIGREIAATDRQIDELVYELYGLSDKEVKIVEDATAGFPLTPEVPTLTSPTPGR